MEFDKLSKSEKIAYWNDVEENIYQCLSLCGKSVPPDLAQEIREYLSHNELGVALEFLADMAIEHEWNISDEAKSYILQTFKKMEYDKEETDKYEKWLNAI